jgi:hypothetical protein
MKNLYDQAVVVEVRQRVASLRQDGVPRWGKKNVAQAAAHCDAEGMGDVHVSPSRPSPQAVQPLARVHCRWSAGEADMRTGTTQPWTGNSPPARDSAALSALH